MKRRHSIIVIAVAALLLIGSSPIAISQERTEGGYIIASPGYQYKFPRDHGRHDGFAIEWWYLTGHLDSEDERFGYQLTFFRLAQKPPEPKRNLPENKNPSFQDSHWHLAHAAVSSPERGHYFHEERLNREGWDAAAAAGDLDLRNGNWNLKRNPDNSFALTMSVRSDVDLKLVLTPEKQPVVFGENGISRKSSDSTSASHYITFTRFSAEGTLRVQGDELAVTGQSWMDHEISSSQLSTDQVGWDWVSIQFDDDREIMAYVLRREDGSYDPVSSLTWIGKNGDLTESKIGNIFQWIPGGDWTSGDTGATYPIAPKIETVDPATGAKRRLTIRPLMKKQEVVGAVTGMAYWEGACDVLDDSGAVIGRAYLELAGYTPGLQERLRPK